MIDKLFCSDSEMDSRVVGSERGTANDSRVAKSHCE